MSTFGYYFKKGLDLIGLDAAAAETLAPDENAFGPGLAIALLAGFSLAVGKLIWDPDRFHFLYVLVAPFGFLILFTAGVFVVHLIALLLGGHGSLVSLHRTAAVGTLIGWTMIVPVLGWIVALWYLPMLIRIVQKTHALDRSRALRSILLAAALVLNVYLVILGLQACTSQWFHPPVYLVPAGPPSSAP